MQTMVTGASGFVGGGIALALLGRGDTVRGLVRDPGRAKALAERGVELAQGDMKDTESLRRAIQGVECVYHTAAVVGDWLDQKEAWRVNVEGTRDLMQACAEAGVRRVIHIASLAVYGNKHHRGTDESAPYGHGDLYTDTKVASERVVLGFARQEQVEAVSLRPGFVYGPGDRMLVPTLVDGIVTGKFRYIGDGSKQMNSIYIDDVAQAALLADSKPEANGQAYNITDGAGTPLREFITFMCNELGIPPPTKRVPPPLAVPLCYGMEWIGRRIGMKKAPMANISRLRFLYYNQQYSIAKARRELGYEPRYTYKEGLPPTLAWFREQGLLPKQVAAMAKAGD